MKFKGKLIAAAIAGMMLAGGAAMAQEMKFWRIGTGGAGGTYFPIGGLIANAISSPPGARACDKGGTCGVPGLIAIAVSTNASVANMNAIHAGQLDAGPEAHAPAGTVGPAATAARRMNDAVEHAGDGEGRALGVGDFHHLPGAAPVFAGAA